MNLLAETLKCLADHNKSVADVLYVADQDTYTTWKEFAKVANIEYDDSFGTQYVNAYLQIIGKDFWLERHEYDGSEWWAYKTQPVLPKTKGPVLILNGFHKNVIMTKE